MLSMFCPQLQLVSYLRVLIPAHEPLSLYFLLLLRKSNEGQCSGAEPPIGVTLAQPQGLQHIHKVHLMIWAVGSSRNIQAPFWSFLPLQVLLTGATRTIISPDWARSLVFLLMVWHIFHHVTNSGCQNADFIPMFFFKSTFVLEVTEGCMWGRSVEVKGSLFSHWYPKCSYWHKLATQKQLAKEDDYWWDKLCPALAYLLKSLQK